MSGLPNPPRWASRLLAIALPARDRDAVTGDLLEEYRETIAPTCGERYARRWYAWQVTAYASPLLLAAAVAMAHLIWNLYNSAAEPFESDTIAGDLLFIAPALLTPMVIGFLATRRSGFLIDAIRMGILACMVMHAIGTIETFLRVNIFLNMLQYRDDWVGLIERYHASGFHTLRAFANYEYLHDLPIVFGVTGLIGTALSAVGGGAARLIGPSRQC